MKIVIATALVLAVSAPMLAPVSAAAAQQTCYSARKCKGKVLNHKDRHNCKNSGGKSWRSNAGVCVNL